MPQHTKTTRWDANCHLALLQAIVLKAPPNPKEWDLIIAEVQSKGYDYTVSAALQHLQKLRRKEAERAVAAAADGTLDDPNATPTPGPSKTPAKRASKDKGKAPAKPAKRKIETVVLDDSEEDPDEDPAQREKRLKRERERREQPKSTVMDIINSLPPRRSASPWDDERRKRMEDEAMIEAGYDITPTDASRWAHIEF